MTALLEIRDLNVWYAPAPNRPRVHIVRDVTLTMSARERLALVGESGAGKSTALYSLLGLLPPHAEIVGDVRFAGRDVLSDGYRGLAALRGHGVSLVTQSAMNALNPVHRVERQVREAMPAEAGPRGARRDRCVELLDRVGLPESVARRFPHELSGGMRQRVAIAIALASKPKLLIADEATTALDTVVQARIMELLDDLSSSYGLAVLFATHHLALAAQFCDRLAVMYAGRIIEQGASSDLLVDAKHPYTRLLFEATPDLGERKEALRSIPGAPPPPTETSVGCAFAPRCPVAVERCRIERPELAPAGHGGSVACHCPQSASVTRAG